MKIKNTDVLEKFFNYPERVRDKMVQLRSLILEVAKEEGIEHLEETLKWGEPSYLTKKGSTIRIDWKEKAPDQYSMYFNCNTKLISTFKEIYPDTFHYIGNREIVFNLNETIHVNELKHCIALSLKYHKIKKLPLLGVSDF